MRADISMDISTNVNFNPLYLQANPELTSIWAIGQKMWSRDLPGIYEALNRDWSETVKPITAAILGK